MCRWIIIFLLPLSFVSITRADERPAPAPVPPVVSTAAIVPAVRTAPAPVPPDAKPPELLPAPGPVLAAPEPNLKNLDQQAAKLKALREKLSSERTDQAPEPTSPCAACADDIMKARLRLAEVLTKIEVQRKQLKAKAEDCAKAEERPARDSAATADSPKPTAAQGADKGKAKSKELPHPEGVPGKLLFPETNERGQPRLADLGKPVDPMAMAQALFETGDFEGALATYRLLDLKSLNKTDRAAAQYLMGTCLRRLGKIDEAATLYREVVNAKEDDILADCAQWQLSAFRWRRDLENQLEQIRQRRHALEANP
jgi:tetratricopeptide (TPR) repeat protein